MRDYEMVLEQAERMGYSFAFYDISKRTYFLANRIQKMLQAPRKSMGICSIFKIHLSHMI